jgi:prevent-host-death family protein
MSDTVNIHEAKTQLSKLVERAEAGHETVIARAGKPVAKLVPLPKAGSVRKLGALKGRIQVPADFDAALPTEIAAAFEGR